MKWFWIMVSAALLPLAPNYGIAQQPKNTSPYTQPQVSEVKEEPAGTAKGFSLEERKAYEEKIAKELDSIQRKIADLRIQANTGASQNKRTLSLTANNIQMQKIAAERELIALEGSSEASWDAQKAKLEKAMGDLRKAFW